jgi:hypothetical protein
VPQGVEVQVLSSVPHTKDGFFRDLYGNFWNARFFSGGFQMISAETQYQRWSVVAAVQQKMGSQQLLKKRPGPGIGLPEVWIVQISDGHWPSPARGMNESMAAGINAHMKIVFFCRGW